MADYIDNVKVGDTDYRVQPTLYGTCGDAAATVKKTATIANFALVAGVTVHVKFTNANGVANPTLNVNSTGDIAIKRYGTTAPSTSAATSWNSGAVVSFTYDGTNWMMNDWLNNNDNTVPSAYCTTAAGTAAKTATCTDYVLLANSYLHVLIKTANTAKSALTLNVNSKGAKTIYINGAVSSASNYTLPAGTYLVFYNGTNYFFRTDGKLTASITGDATTVNGKTVGANVPETAVFTDTTYTAQKTSVGSASAGTAIAADDITKWSAGTMFSASVSGEKLVLTAGTAPTLTYTARSIPNISVSSVEVVNGITAN